MLSLTQKELKKMMLTAYEKIEQNKEEINRINVFPVPDQDTGTNLSQTLNGIKTGIEDKDYHSLESLCEDILDRALGSAQGNAGVIFTGFLSGFLPILKNEDTINAKKMAQAMEIGAAKARQAIQNPRDGTILDVIDAAKETFKKEVKTENDIVKILSHAIEKARLALMATREKMEVFRKANVVDAGGLGFLVILEGYLSALSGRKKEKEIKEMGSEKIKKFVQTLSYRYEVVALIEEPKFSQEKIKQKLKKLGNSLDMVQVGHKMKIHIHTDLPEEVKKILRQSGKILDLREEDMAKEVVGEESLRKVSIGIVCEDVACLLPKIIDRYQIAIVQAKLIWSEADKAMGKMPKTSQASPKSYLDAFNQQLQKFQNVLCVSLASKISGSYNSACQAKKMLPENEQKRVFIFDSEHAAGSQALLILKAIELIQEQREILEVIKKLTKLKNKTYLYFALKDPKWLVNIGRISQAQANWIKMMKRIGLHPLLELKNGLIKKSGIVLAKDESTALFKKIMKESKGQSIRVIINHADNIQGAEKLKKLVKEKLNAEVSFISTGPLIICAATGPGTLLASWTTK